jgi:hypothetical protein
VAGVGGAAGPCGGSGRAGLLNTSLNNSFLESSSPTPEIGDMALARMVNGQEQFENEQKGMWGFDCDAAGAAGTRSS